MKRFFILSLVLLSFNALQAQLVQTGDTLAGAATQPNAAAPMTSGDSLKQAMSNFKSALSDINKLFTRKSDTMLIVIPQIEYDNSSLARLKECLKKAKGVRTVTTHYSDATATLEIAYKGKPNEVWEMLPEDAKAAFRLTELGTTSITLQYKQKSP